MNRQVSENYVNPLVSVIIPCYNQAHFLREAIESVLAQSYSPVEIVVVDDGSSDNTSEVAREYQGVKVVRQTNQGLSAARNSGLRQSAGNFLVFLDADDRLLPGALQAGVDSLRANPDCAFAAGSHRFIDAAGKVLGEWTLSSADPDAYCALLQRNFIAMHAAVMYRRALFDAVGIFNTALRASEDYELYLRTARRFPVAIHDAVVAEYRRHGSNMTQDSSLMLRTTLAVLQAEWPHVRSNRRYEQAYHRGLQFWQRYYIGQMVKQLRALLVSRRWRQAAPRAIALARAAPRFAISYFRQVSQQRDRSSN